MAIGKGFIYRRRNHLTLVIHGFTPHTIRHAAHDRKLKLTVTLVGVILKLAIRDSTKLAGRFRCKVNYSIFLKLATYGISNLECSGYQLGSIGVHQHNARLKCRIYEA